MGTAVLLVAAVPGMAVLAAPVVPAAVAVAVDGVV